MGRTYLLKNSSGRSPLTDGKMPCLLRCDWSKPINAESGRGKRLGRFENKRPETILKLSVFSLTLFLDVFYHISRDPRIY
ncbi:hypothetical protein TNCV_3767661 [Trichonephila clavipes]|nr:hypothetical protein TNCV_3767661 [Trichonephila clavipes]